MKNTITGPQKKLYMNPVTGSVDTYDGWWYTDIDGNEVNAVDLDEVIEVDENGEEL
jgi:hypothetical protein